MGSLTTVSDYEHEAPFLFDAVPLAELVAAGHGPVPVLDVANIAVRERRPTITGFVDRFGTIDDGPPGTILIIAIPFTGDAAFFGAKAEGAKLYKPYARVEDGHVVVKIITHDEVDAHVRHDIDSVAGGIAQSLDTLRAAVANGGAA